MTFVDTESDLTRLLRKHLPVNKDREPESRFLFIYDVKSWNDRHALDNTSRPWAKLAALDENHLTKCMEAMFSQDKAAGKGHTLFGPNDMGFVLDGRRAEVASKIRNAVLKATNGHPYVNKRAMGPAIRLFYMNSEFGRSGHGTGQRSKFVTLVDPLETMHSVIGNSAVTEERARAHVDIPGTNRTRGLSNLRLRSEEQHDMKVKKSVYAEMQKSMTVSADNDADAGEEMPIQKSASDPDGDNECDDAEAIPWYSWSMQEEFWLELIHMWGAATKQTTDISFTPGFGQLEMAAIRKDIDCVTIVANATHRKLLQQRLCLSIMLEGLRGEIGLFRGRRVLSAQRSLGGTSSGLRAGRSKFAGLIGRSLVVGLGLGLANCYCVWLYPKPLNAYISCKDENEIIPKTHTKTNSSLDIGYTGIEENLIVSWFCVSTSQKTQSKFAPLIKRSLVETSTPTGCNNFTISG